MNILAIDYGSKNIGLAWTDTHLGVVLPFGKVQKKSLNEKIKELVKIIESERLDKVIVGFPVGTKGEENNNTERVKNFVFELQKKINLPFEYYDERFSSQAADALGDGVSRDEKSAMVILEGYLHRANLKK